MKLSDVFKQIKFQTLVGWTVGYIAGIVLNDVLGSKFDNKFWLSLGGVLVVRITTDVLFAIKEAQKANRDSHPSKSDSLPKQRTN